MVPDVNRHPAAGETVTTPVRRTYSPREGRQQRPDRMVSNEVELRTVLGLAGFGEDVGTIRLSANIFLSRALVLPSGGVDVVIDGGGRFSIGCESTFSDTELLQTSGVTSGILFRDLSFLAPTTKLERLILIASTCIGLSFSGVSLGRIKRLVQSDTGVKLYQYSTFRNVRMWGLALGDVTSTGEAQFERCSFEYLYASVGAGPTHRFMSVEDAAGSTNNVCLQAGPPASDSAPFVADFRTCSLHALFAKTTLTVGEDTRFTLGSVTLSGANPTLDVDVTPQTVINYTLGGTSSGDATLSTPFDTGTGKLLVLVCSSNTGTAKWKDSTTLRLSADFTPAAHDTLTVLWDGTQWVELARSVN